MATAKVTSKGQITLPKEIRDRLGVHEGDRVDFFEDAQGRIILLPASQDVRRLRGMIKPPARAVSIEQMNEAIRERGGEP